MKEPSSNHRIITMNESFTLFLGLTTKHQVALIEEAGMTRASIGSDIAGTLSTYGIDGFTLTFCEGYWRGESESAVQIFISGVTYADARGIAKDLGARFEQESVGLRMENELQFIDAPVTTLTVTEL